MDQNDERNGATTLLPFGRGRHPFDRSLVLSAKSPPHADDADATETSSASRGALFEGLGEAAIPI